MLPPNKEHASFRAQEGPRGRPRAPEAQHLCASVRGEAAPSERPSAASMEPLAERSLLGSPGASSSMDDESVLMRPSQRPFLRTIQEHKPVRVVTPKRHLLKQNNTISETGLQIVKMTCRDSSTKGALLSVADPAAWAMLSPPRKKTAPDYERWRNRLDFQAAYEPDLSATSHLVSPSEPALSPSMSEISDCTFDGYSSPIPVRSFDAVSPPPPILSEDDISHSRCATHRRLCCGSIGANRRRDDGENRA